MPANILIALVAIIHIYILVLEMFLWETKTGRKAFNLSVVFARETRGLPGGGFVVGAVAG